MTLLFTKYRNLFINKCFNINYRLCHTDNLVRVRFAPSPTGFLHLGGLRTALYNFLFAKMHNGKFILRIEDTDQSRIVQGAMEQLCKDLEWAGIIPDEGPLHGGEHGPYIQSQRLDIYKDEVKKLLENGTAYYCFCTERRLDLLRREALRARQVPKYDNRCRELTPIQIAEKLANNDKYCIRFKLDLNFDKFHDIIYGNIKYNITQNEGDPIIVKTDGYPTYHIANIIDDHYMKITHVLRGVEWQISTPKHLLMYKAFNWTPPDYGHLPLIMNPDGSKLSKRQGDIQIEHYRDKGILPQALVNYVTLTGGGFAKETSIKHKSYKMNELINMFDIERINAHSSRLNPDLLDDCNRLELINIINDPIQCDKLVQDVKNLIQITYPKYINNLDLNENHIKNILKWSSSRITTVKELIDGKLSFLWILPKLTNDTNINEDTINLLIKHLENEHFTKINLQNLLKEFSTKNNLIFSNFMKSLRSLLSGLKEGPGVAEMMEILGKENTLQRIKFKKKK